MGAQKSANIVVLVEMEKEKVSSIIARDVNNLSLIKVSKLTLQGTAHKKKKKIKKKVRSKKRGGGGEKSKVGRTLSEVTLGLNFFQLWERGWEGKWLGRIVDEGFVWESGEGRYMWGNGTSWWASCVKGGEREGGRGGVGGDGKN